MVEGSGERLFGRFEVLRELGRGAYGVVLECVDKELGRTVALKVLRSGERARFVEIERLRREAQALARVRHPNVVVVHGAGSKDGVHYVAMEPVRGRSLRQLLPELPLERRLDVIEQVARGLHAAHEVGVVHRDVKPANVLVDGEGRARVIDFGLAHVSDASSDLTDTGATIGTPHYMAPELVGAGRGDVGPRSDVYGLGAMLFEALTGEVVHLGARTPQELYARLVSDTPSPRARERRRDVPPALDAVCSRALEKDISLRYESAALFADALGAAHRGVASPRVLPRLLWLLPGAVALAAIAALPGAAPPPPAPVGGALPGALPAPGPPARPEGPPDWFTGLDARERPPLPLPPGLRPGPGRGEYVNERDGSVLLFVPGGLFFMGSEEAGERARPVHPVRLSPYFIGACEVTHDQFAAFVRATGHRTTAEQDGMGWVATGGDTRQRPRASWRAPGGDGREPHAREPVVQLSWHDAQAYCYWAGLSLPTEAQWERAAGWDPAGRQRAFAWGDEVPGPRSLLRANVLDLSGRTLFPGAAGFEGYQDGFAGRAPVGSFPLGASAIGALDMTGNVAEWCQDVGDEGFYSRSPVDDPVQDDPNGLIRAVRGGSFADGPRNCRVATRGRSPALACGDWLGFRVALAPKRR